MVLGLKADRSRDGTIRGGENDRQARAGQIVNDLGHQQQSLRRGGGVGAHSGRARAADHRSCRELGIHADVLGREVSIRNHPSKEFHDMGLGRDGIS